MIVLRSDSVVVDIDDNCSRIYSYKPLDAFPTLDQGTFRKFGFGVSKTTVSRASYTEQFTTETKTAIVYLYDYEVGMMYSDVVSFWEMYIENTNTLIVHKKDDEDE